MRKTCSLLFILCAISPALAYATPAVKIAHDADATAVKEKQQLISYENQRSKLVGRIETLGTLRQAEAFPIDKDGHRYAPEPAFDVRLRVGFDYRHTIAKLIWLDANYEHDMYSGIIAGGSEDQRLLVDANRAGGSSHVRNAKLSLRLGPVALSGGFTTSHWGLGLLANDGKHGWTPSNAAFSDPRRGDRVLRGSVLMGPFTKARVAITLAYDSVVDDDILIGDDTAEQFIGAVLLNPKRARTAGIYVARRIQSNHSGGETRVTAFDAYGKWTQESVRSGTPFVLTAEAEAAAIIGTTELGPTPDFETHDVLQFGFMGRLSFGERRWGTVLDFLYASGDQNMDDGQVNNFKADRNIEMGQLLFRHALTAISARSSVTAADPDLVGEPAKDLDRLPTRGAVTNTVSLFPRLWWRVADQLTAYGGPLFAFASLPTSDPLNTRTSGGVARNAYDAEPAIYLGTEINVGMRYTPAWRKTHFLFGIEGAHFTPGSAFVDIDGQRPSPITGGRLFVGYTL